MLPYKKRKSHSTNHLQKERKLRFKNAILQSKSIHHFFYGMICFLLVYLCPFYTSDIANMYTFDQGGRHNGKTTGRHEDAGFSLRYS